MVDKPYSKQPFEKPEPGKERKVEKSEEREMGPEGREKKLEKVEAEERVVPTVEVLKTAATSPPPTPKGDLTKEEEKEINDLVSLTIKNPNLEKGLSDANKKLNEEIKRLKSQGKQYAYLIDEFHDRLVLKIQEREAKFKK